MPVPWKGEFYNVFDTQRFTEEIKKKCMCVWELCQRKVKSRLTEKRIHAWLSTGTYDTKEELSGIVRLKRYERETDENERER